jgi:hypothetical protein
MCTPVTRHWPPLLSIINLSDRLTDHRKIDWWVSFFFHFFPLITAVQYCTPYTRQDGRRTDAKVAAHWGKD